jgi:hypothetical protein
MASRRFRPADPSPSAVLLAGYRVVVSAASVRSVVEAAGGFLCDRARAGWDVSVLLAGDGDARPLAILGVAAHHEPGPDVGSMIRELAHGATVVVDAELLERDPDARDALTRAVRRTGGRVRLWGRPALTHVGSGLAEIPYELSQAAMAFKGHALRAAGSPGVAEPVEVLYQVCGESNRRLYSV